MTDSLILQKRGSIATISLNHPPANTWNLQSLQQFEQMIGELNQDSGIVSLVITSQSDKFFSAGIDLTLFADGEKQQAATIAATFGRAFEALADFRGLSIAAINGFAMGSGLELALACDLRLVSEKAVMALPEARVGLLPCAGGTQHLTMLVGEGWAKRMMLCGERVDGELAVTIGLAEELIAADSLESRALELAQQAAEQSPDSLVACKQLIQMHRSLPLRQGLSAERELFLALFEGKNRQEGVQAFLEKRAPVWEY